MGELDGDGDSIFERLTEQDRLGLRITLLRLATQWAEHLDPAAVVQTGGEALSVLAVLKEMEDLLPQAQEEAAWIAIQAAREQGAHLSHHDMAKATNLDPGEARRRWRRAFSPDFRPAQAG